MLLLEYFKIKCISKNLYDLLAENDLYNIIDDLQNSRDGKNYFDLSYTDLSKISYLKGDRIPDNDDLIYDKEYRKNKAYHGKIGKLLSDKISQADIQKISKIMYTRQKENEFKMIVTDNICHYYHEDNYSHDHGNNGQLHNSCMRHDSLQNAIALYEKIGNDKVQLLVALDQNDLVVGRSLLWHNVEYKGDKIEYLDRVYSSNDNISQLFSDYADQNDLIKYGESDHTMMINVDIDQDDHIPYFDTFSYYSYSGYISSKYADIELSCTEGYTLADIDSQECSECGSQYNRDDLFYSDCVGGYLCENCGIFIDDEVYPIDQCIQINDTWYHKESDKIVFSDHHQDYILSENSVYIESESDYFDLDSDDIVFSEYNDNYILKENSVYSEYHQDYFDQDDVIFSDYHQDYLLSDHEDIAFSKYHNDYIIIDHDDIVYIKCFDDYFTINDECIYFDDQDQEYKHKQYLMVL